ncbi:MAG: NAD-dependent epimerase/dehydratase family protein [Verrucomicrobiota bacterium]
MKIGVIGASGFIGRSLLAHFAKAGSPAVAFSRRPLSPEISESASACRLLSLSDTERHLGELDWLLFCTGSMLPSDNVTAEQLHSASQEAILLQQCIQRTGIGVIYVSSGGTVYGNTSRVPVPETEPCAPISIYGKYKLALEIEAAELSRTYHKKLVIARLSNPYGPLQTAQKGQGLIARLVHCRHTGEAFTLWGNGDAVRDYIHIDDFGSFVSIAIQKGAEGIFNVGSGQGRTVMEMLDLFSTVCPDHRVSVKKIAARQCDVSRIVLDIDKARQRLDWAPRVALIDGIRSLIKSS